MLSNELSYIPTFSGGKREISLMEFYESPSQYENDLNGRPH
jgi:hypothetical protein